MKLDLEVLKGVTGAFLDSEYPTTDFRQLHDALPDISDESLAWYLNLLYDDDYLVQDSREPGIGIKRDEAGNLYWSVVPLRLTSQGMEFSASLQRPEALKLITKAAKGIPLTLRFVTEALRAGGLLLGA